jgi:DNA-directed RNA polymerase subunit L/DNA-directed RNA polymerase alpha subunit
MSSSSTAQKSRGPRKPKAQASSSAETPKQQPEIQKPLAESSTVPSSLIQPGGTFSQFSQIKNFFYINLPEVDEEQSGVILKKEKITFVWSNINLQFANSFRRILISEIPIYVLGNFYYHNFSIPNTAQNHLFEMSRLQPVMHNEQLSLVLELIPINQELCHKIYGGENKNKIMVNYGYSLEKDKFEPRGKEIKHNIQNVYTSDLNVYVVDENQNIIEMIPNSLFFSRKVLITKLKINQKMAFTCSPILGYGKENSKFTPVCSASFDYDIADFQPSSESKTLYEKTYETDTNMQQVTHLRFTIQSLPYYTPEQVMLLGFTNFKLVFIRFNYKIDQIFENIQQIKIESVEEKYITVTFEIQDENYTVGNIFQHYILKNPQVSYAASVIEHPKIKKLKIKTTIQVAHMETQLSNYLPEFQSIFKNTITRIITDCEISLLNFKSKFNIKQ